jgi:hypothetical protein
VAAVVALPGALADVLHRALVLGPDHAEDLRGALDRLLAASRRPAEEVSVDGEGRLAADPAARVGDHRDERAHRLGVLDRERLADHPAHRGADDVGGLDLEVAHQLERVGRHVGEAVLTLGHPPQPQLSGRRDTLVVEVGRAPDVAVVEADDVKAALGELLAELLVPPDHLGREAHDQEQRRVRAVAELLIAEGDSPADVCELLVHRVQGYEVSRGCRAGRFGRASCVRHVRSGRA